MEAIKPIAIAGRRGITSKLSQPINTPYSSPTQCASLATGRSFSDVSPVKGTYKGTSQHTLEVGVTVSYEDGTVSEEHPAVLVTQPSKTTANNSHSNSYRRHLEMIQQQQ